MFKKSIFGQLFSITVLIFLVSFIVIGTLMYSFLGDYVTQQREDDLREGAKKVNELTLLFLENNSALSEKIYKLNLDAFSSNSGAFVIILNTDGKTVAATGDKTNVEVKREYYADVLNGNEVRYIGNFGGVFNTTMLTIGVPLTYGNNVVGATFLNLAVPEINQFRFDILRIFVMTVGIIILIALVFIYAVSRKLTTPLKELNAAAKHIASGEFERRVHLDVENEIGELGQTFNEMADSLQQLEDMRSSFISNVSHELRTPMTTITGFVEGIIDGTIPPERQEQYLSIVLDESRRLSRLVTDLLDLTRLDQNRLKLDMSGFDINEQLRLQVIKVERRIEAKNIDVMVDFENNPQLVYADRDSILRVLTNLLDNAIKFTPEGGYIELRTGLTDKKVFVSVSNSGPGISPEDLRHVFDRFFKTDKSRSQDKKGVGLGLYIVKSIISAHGEQIWVTSEVDRYTRFTFTLSPEVKEADSSPRRSKLGRRAGRSAASEPADKAADGQEENNA